MIEWITAAFDYGGKLLSFLPPRFNPILRISLLAKIKRVLCEVSVSIIIKRDNAPPLSQTIAKIWTPDYANLHEEPERITFHSNTTDSSYEIYNLEDEDGLNKINIVCSGGIRITQSGSIRETAEIVSELQHLANQFIVGKQKVEIVAVSIQIIPRRKNSNADKKTISRATKLTSVSISKEHIQIVNQGFPRLQENISEAFFILAQEFA